MRVRGEQQRKDLCFILIFKGDQQHFAAQVYLFWLQIIVGWRLSDHVKHPAVGADRSGQAFEELQEERATCINTSMYHPWGMFNIVVSVSVSSKDFTASLLQTYFNWVCAGFRAVHLSWSWSLCDLAFLEVTPLLAALKACLLLLSSRYLCLVGLRLVGFNPIDHLHCQTLLLHSWARKTQRKWSLEELDWGNVIARFVWKRQGVPVFIMLTVPCAVRLDTAKTSSNVTLLHHFVLFSCSPL